MSIKKLLFTIISVLILLVLSNSIVFADTSIKVKVDNKLLTFETEPFAENGTTLVPMRKIFEALNANVQWVNKTKQIIVTKNNDCIVLTIGSKTAKKNGKDIELLVAPKIVNGSTYVPVRFVAEALNAEVIWDKKTRTVIINSNPEDVRQEEEDQFAAFSDYVPYSTSDLVTLARNIINGDVVYFNGQYWATPEFANSIANEEVVYMNDVSDGSDVETNDRYSLLDLDLDEVFRQTEWISEDSYFLGDMSFVYSALVKDGEIVRAGYFYDDRIGRRVYTLWDMTEEFAKAQKAEAKFSDIRIKKIDGKHYFYKEDLIKKGIIKNR